MKKFTKLTARGKKLASQYIAEEIATGQYPRKQAIAIGISRAKHSNKSDRPVPLFRKGDQISIDKLNETGRIVSGAHYDPFIGEHIYEIKLHRTGKEVQWTEKHLTLVNRKTSSEKSARQSKIARIMAKYT